LVAGNVRAGRLGVAHIYRASRTVVRARAAGGLEHAGCRTAVAVQGVVVVALLGRLDDAIAAARSDRRRGEVSEHLDVAAFEKRPRAGRTLAQNRVVRHPTGFVAGDGIDHSHEPISPGDDVRRAPIGADRYGDGVVPSGICGTAPQGCPVVAQIVDTDRI